MVPGWMDMNKWPGKAKEAYNYGTTGFGAGWSASIWAVGPQTAGLIARSLLNK